MKENKYITFGEPVYDRSSKLTLSIPMKAYYMKLVILAMNGDQWSSGNWGCNLALEGQEDIFGIDYFTIRKDNSPLDMQEWLCGADATEDREKIDPVSPELLGFMVAQVKELTTIWGVGRQWDPETTIGKVMEEVIQELMALSGHPREHFHGYSKLECAMLGEKLETIIEKKFGSIVVRPVPESMLRYWEEYEANGRSKVVYW